MEPIYLDNAATTRVDARIAEAMGNVMTESYGNPSSVHFMGLDAERLMEQSRQKIKHVMQCKHDTIVFTSGGTEANNLAIRGALSGMISRSQTAHIITTKIEHASVARVFDWLEERGFSVTRLGVDRTGVISSDALRDALTRETKLVSIMHVNNEIGSIQPVAEIGAILKDAPSHPVFHVDAVQSFGKYPFLPAQWGIDLAAVSAHKIHGPKGTGALYIRKGMKLAPISLGGGHEEGLRSGTPNVPGIVGLGLAAEDMASFHTADHTMALKKRFVELTRASIPDIRINGPGVEEGASHILNVGFRSVKGEVLANMLSEQGVCVSTGSACSQRKKPHASHVLQAIGVPQDYIEGSIRISFSKYNSIDEIEKSVEILKYCVGKARQFVRR
jgi:cysteine desulfurase